MSITPEVAAKTLTQLVATEIRVQMARADVRQSQLAREIGKTEQWLSVRLRGRQPIDLNDLALIAGGLRVGVHDLLPQPNVVSALTSGQNKDRKSPRYVRPISGDEPATTASPVSRGRRDAARPVSAIPANRRRPIAVRPPNRPKVA